MLTGPEVVAVGTLPTGSRVEGSAMNSSAVKLRIAPSIPAVGDVIDKKTLCRA